MTIEPTTAVQLADGSVVVGTDEFGIVQLRMPDGSLRRVHHDDLAELVT